MFNQSVLLNPSDRIVLLVAKLTIHQTEIDEIDNCLSKITDWDAFTIQIIKRGMAGLFQSKISQFKNKVLIPADNLLLIEQAYLRTVNRSVLLLGHFSLIVNELQKADIEVIALKGVYLCENLYSAIGLRQFSDIDILIPVTKAQQAVQILQNLGYNYKESVPVSDFIRAKEDKVHLPPMYLNGVSVELHIKLHSANQPYKVNIERVFATRIPVKVNGNEVFALDFMHQLIHITLHTHKHFDEGNVNFTSFTDIVNLINSLPDDFYWSSFIKLCDAYKATQTIFKYLILIQQFYSIHVIPDELLTKYSSKVDDKFKTQFIRYLQGYKYVETATTAIPGHINSLRMLKNPMEIANYLIDLFFPPKKFMIDKYAIKNEKLYIFYYPYRYLTIFSGLWQILIQKLKK
ncbi:MAG: nucleotidyltransferase domain-containing protein [Paludibacter sp.]